MSSACAAEETTLFVSPEGNDAWSGTRPALVQGTEDGPFRSLPRARDAIRELRRARGALPGPVTVFLRGGTYHLTEALLLSPADSGTSECPITYAAYTGERPVISGGIDIRGWKRTGNGSLAIHLPATASGQWFFRQLFVRGHASDVWQRRYRPSLGAFVVAGLTDAPAREGMAHRRSQDEFRFRPGDIRQWENLTDVEVVALHDWSASRLRIREIDAEKNIVRFTGFPVYRIGHWWKNARNPYYVENVKEAFGQPGEWYLDRSNGTLRYTPAAGEHLDALNAVAPRTDVLLRLQGDPAAGLRVEHIRFSGLTFSFTHWTLPAEGYSAGQGMVNLPAAVEMEGAGDVHVVDCTFAHLGAYALSLGPGCGGNRVVGCRMFDLAGGGVKVGGGTPVPKNNTIENNVIADGGRVHFSAHGIWSGITDHTVIRHNVVRRFLYSNISIGWAWHDRPTACRANVIENNHIHDAMLLLADGGAIYSLGRQPDTVIRGNLIHDVHRSVFAGRAPNNGMFLDQGSKGFLIEDNVIYRTAGSPFRHNQNEPEWHTWSNNTTNVLPDAPDFPAAGAARAGLESDYAHLLEQVPETPLPPMLTMELPVLPPDPVRDDFENPNDAQAARVRRRQGAGDQVVLEISDDTAASGTRSLKFVDGPDAAKPFYPYVHYVPSFAKGRATVSLALHVDAATSLYIEGRDEAANLYKAGPRLSIDTNQRLRAGDRVLATVPTGAWFRITMRFPLGDEADGTFAITVDIPGNTPVTVADLPMQNSQFRRLDWFGVVAEGQRRTTFYLDDVSILNE